MNKIQNIEKRDGTLAPYDEEKIVVAIEKAMKYGSGIYKLDIAKEVAKEITAVGETIGSLTIRQVEDMVYSKLVSKGEGETAKAYEGYRAVQEYKRKNNTTDESIMGLINMTNTDVMNENSNKNATLNSTQRDLIAGEVSKDLVRRKLFPAHLIQAHDQGHMWIHDRDYLAQPMHNCEIINLEDMLKNGTVMNEKKISTPKSFQVASTITTQIIQAVTSMSYGGASINGIDRILAPYARKSYDKAYKKHIKRLSEDMVAPRAMVEDMASKYADEDMKKEIRDGVQTIQYQINTMNGSNGRAIA